jgi:plastocyanin
MPSISTRTRACAAIAVVCLTSACSTSSDAPAPATVAPPPEAAAADSTATTGRVVGRAPVPNSTSAVVVALEPRTTRVFPLQDEKPVMDQVGLTFGPELLLVRTGQPVEFRNSDDTLHNVHVTHEETREAAFNVAIPTGAAYEYTFKRDGFYRVGCDIHPSMGASIFSASTPYTALAESDGRFAFTNVPAGSWTLTVYVAGRRLQRDVNVKAGVTEVAVE